MGNWDCFRSIHNGLLLCHCLCPHCCHEQVQSKLIRKSQLISNVFHLHYCYAFGRTAWLTSIFKNIISSQKLKQITYIYFTAYCHMFGNSIDKLELEGVFFYPSSSRVSLWNLWKFDSILYNVSNPH